MRARLEASRRAARGATQRHTNYNIYRDNIMTRNPNKCLKIMLYLENRPRPYSRYLGPRRCAAHHGWAAQRENFSDLGDQNSPISYKDCAARALAVGYLRHAPHAYETLAMNGEGEQYRAWYPRRSSDGIRAAERSDANDQARTPAVCATRVRSGNTAKMTGSRGAL